MGFKFSPAVIDKLKNKHNVTQKEVMECFNNGEAIFFIDDREEHATDPPTKWFMAPTNRGRLLKVFFIVENGDIEIKTAFEPTSPSHLETYIQKAGLPRCWPNDDEEEE
jgi:hypothetical protein